MDGGHNVRVLTRRFQKSGEGITEITWGKLLFTCSRKQPAPSSNHSSEVIKFEFSIGLLPVANRD